jgi:tetratricopeptide (TPR) repeat protein
MPDKKDVFRELGILVTSPLFRRKKQAVRMLTYIIEETLEGRSSFISQRSIAIALDKPRNFDPTSNPSIRMEASRLRKLLKDYYENDGKNNDIYIHLSENGYVPLFTQNKRKHVRISEGPRILPCFQNVTNGDDTQQRYHLAQNRFTQIASHFNFFTTLSPYVYQPEESADTKALQHYAQNKTNADFFLLIQFIEETKNTHIKMSACHAPKGDIIYETHETIDPDNFDEQLDQIYLRTIYDLLGGSHGQIYNHWVYKLEQENESIPAHNQALFTLRSAIINLSPDKVETTIRTCLQRLEKHPDDHITIITLGKSCFQAFLSGHVFDEELLTTWLQTAQTARKIVPNCAEAHIFLATAFFAHNNPEACKSEILLALKANPYDYCLKYMAAILYYLLGEGETAFKYSQEVSNISDYQPTWYSIIPAFYYFHQQQDYEKALQEASILDHSFPWGYLLRAAIYMKLDNQEMAMKELQQFTAQSPDFREKKNKQLPTLNDSSGALQEMWQTLQPLF